MAKVLVIEDDARVQETIVTFLQEEDFAVVSAADGRSGLELARLEGPELILCDVSMPGMNGYEVLAALRNDDGPLASVPFIFLTARADRPDMRQGMVLGADDYLTKPFTLDELMAAIEACLAKRAKIITPYETELAAMGEKLIYTLYHDSVTGLPNQFLLRRLFAEAAETAARSGKELGLLLFSIERFQHFFGLQGHSLANYVLEAVAARLKASLPKDTPVIHLHGERFVILLSCQHADDLLRQARELLAVLREGLAIGSQEVFLTGSIGIARHPADGDDVEALTRKASLALAEAARLGGSCVHAFSDAYAALTPDQLALERDLHFALVRDELQLYYQPQIDLRTGEVCGAEALLRWQHPQRGLIPPLAFIPLAEESGRILPIGEWVIQTACVQVQAWQNLAPHLRVGLNVSGRQFHHQNLTALVGRTLSDTGLAPTSIELEVTESVVMHDTAVAVATLQAWRALGARISVDDFGTGYSSLSYLRELPFHTVKIDQSFVRHVGTSPENAAIVTAIIQLAHELKLSVIAEGVETVDDLRFLQEHGCDEVQGYLFSKPVPAADFGRALKEKGWPGLDGFLGKR